MLSHDQIEAFRDGADAPRRPELERLPLPARNSVRLAMLTLRLQSALLRRYSPFR